jgi:hypothetical protein
LRSFTGRLTKICVAILLLFLVMKKLRDNDNVN